jgi:predicted ABC-type transport system involved in lysophospholipase L1 biosynthesis ATPase subunit
MGVLFQLMEGLLSLRGVWLSYPRGRRHTVRVLSDVSLDVQPGEVVAVLTQRAQGKTSLLRVAAGMQRPDRGRALFAGQDMWPREPGRHRIARRGHQRPWRNQIALVKRSGLDLQVPALESVALPLGARHGAHEARLRAERALGEVGASGCGDRGWDDLDNGDQVRVALAHALAREPKLLLIDDLTATLGLTDASRIVELIHTLAKTRRMAVLMSVGDARATGFSDRMATLAGGRLLMAPAPPAADHDAAGAEVIDFPPTG